MKHLDTNGAWKAGHYTVIIILFILLTILALRIITRLFTISQPNKDIQQTHRKIGLEPALTNLSSQFSGEHQPAPGKPIVLQSLWIYPLKSCQGIEVSRSRVLPVGLEFDRLYTFAQLKKVTGPLGSEGSKDDQYKWEFITQRQYPLLASLNVELWQPDPAKPKADGKGYILFRFPWKGTRISLTSVIAKLAGGWNDKPEKEVRLPVDFPTDKEIRTKGYTFESCSIWKDKVIALNMEKELPSELSLYLGTRHRLGLFRIDPGRLRQVHRCAPAKVDAGYQPVTGFQDAYPVHLINIASVQDLASKIKMDDILPCLDVQRFRANIIGKSIRYPFIQDTLGLVELTEGICLVSGAAAYDEDSWKFIAFESPTSSSVKRPRFHVSCRTVRCKQPNVNQITGVKHEIEPFKAMRTHRRIDEGAPLKGCMGMEMTPLFSQVDVPENMEHTLVVGMTLKVIERGSHRYIDS
ncbi:hypothetical protein NM208_g599 [Fusarium decemcellulare]|uniref:Uncharacterized protein n=1 Tax=Fusarium decemcellulare TaxID=57161 RepID=A0ACC1SZ62_9HYPO|nr:hypothetical protein NM208_g599 [Fusarium decemcellulare]